MLRNIFGYFCSLAFALGGTIGVVSCSDDNNGLELPDNQLPEGGYITLSMKCVEGTRAPEEEPYTENGVNSLNENLIDKVTIFLWSNGGDKPDETAKPDYVQSFTNINRNNAASFRIPLTTALKNKLFESENVDCHAFAAVNVDIPEGDFTIAELRKITVESTFSNRKSQSSFTMDGDCPINYNPATNTAGGIMDLQRSASKITLALDVDDYVEQTAVVDGALVTSKWMPDTKTMRVWLNGGLSESTLDPDLTVKPGQGYFFNTPDDLTYTFTANTSGVDNTPDNGNNPPVNGETTRTYPFTQDVPFYTYPHSWTAEPDDYAATYMILSIPWMQVDDAGNQISGSSWRTCYYQVPVIAEDSDPLQLVRNVSYHVYLHVGLLGSFEPDVPLELDELEYSAAEWGNVDIDVTIPDVRYLVVDQNDYTVNNETSITIPFYTSHETIVTDATMTFYRYNFSDAGEERAVTVSMQQNELSATRAGEPVFTAIFDNDTKELRVTHELVMYEALDSNNQIVSFTDNDGPEIDQDDDSRKPKTDAQWERVINNIAYFRKQSSSATVSDVNEYSRIEFKITLQHRDIHEGQDDSHNFEEVINITQFPGMYITTVPNYHGVENTTSFNFSGAQGNTGINGNYLTAYSNAWNYEHMPSLKQPNGWTTTIGLNSGNYNYNPNMYLVTVTILPEGTDYRIGDPRSNYINNNLQSSQSGGVSSLPTLPTDLNNMTQQNTYTRQLITTGVNSSLSSNENTSVWTSQTYYWNYWNQNQGSWRILANANYGGPNNPVTVSGFSESEAIYDKGSSGKRNLRYYYPTLEDEAHKMIIAPKFRICSSYAGTTWQLNRELARRRAAAYQEMGYPAGRWRLPTYGEVKFIMELAAEYKIPRLFGTYSATWWYWCAQGLVCVPSKKSNSRSVTLPNDTGFELPIKTGARDCQRARFVYDEWYWGDADLKASENVDPNKDSARPVYTFTWGDKPF